VSALEVRVALPTRSGRRTDPEASEAVAPDGLHGSTLGAGGKQDDTTGLGLEACAHVDHGP